MNTTINICLFVCLQPGGDFQMAAASTAETTGPAGAAAAAGGGRQPPPPPPPPHCSPPPLQLQRPAAARRPCFPKQSRSTTPNATPKTTKVVRKITFSMKLFRNINIKYLRVVLLLSIFYC